MGEGKAHLTVAIGCTGGRHRSPVVIAENLCKHFRDNAGYIVEVAHRDVDKSSAGVIDHIGFEVSDLERAARFYDGVFFALGWRRMHTTGARARLGRQPPQFCPPAAAPAPAYGHVALRAAGRVAVEAAYAAGLAGGGSDDGAPGPRPKYGRGYYAVTQATPTASASRSCRPGALGRGIRQTAG